MKCAVIFVLVLMSAHNGLLQTPDDSERAFPLLRSHQQYFQYTDLTVTCGGFFNHMTKWRVVRSIMKGSKTNCYNNTKQFGACYIHTVYESDSGEYWCESHDNRRSEKVHITVSAANVILRSPVGSVVVGDNVSLLCIERIRQNTTFDFYKDGLLLQSSAAGEMILYNISESDQGRYKCGPSGSKEFSQENLLRVKAVVLECPDEPVKEGERVTLFCRDKMATSNVTYSFYKDDKERKESSTGELTLIKVSKADEGVYKCQSSELRESEAQWLAVEGGDLLVLLPSLPVSLGEDVTLRCLNRSRSPVSALFHRGDQLLSSEPSTDLSLRAVSLDDQGWYRCSHGAMKSPQVLLQVLNRSVTVGESKVPPWVPPTTSSSDPSPTQLLLRLVRHLLVCCPYCMSTVLMVSLYRQKHKENKRPRLRKPKRECEDTAADVTTEYQFGEV